VKSHRMVSITGKGAGYWEASFVDWYPNSSPGWSGGLPAAGAQVDSSCTDPNSLKYGEAQQQTQNNNGKIEALHLKELFFQLFFFNASGESNKTFNHDKLSKSGSPS
jgi:hypothetical protein